MRYLVDVGGETFPLERTEPLEEGQTFTHDSKTYTANFIEQGRDEYDAVVKATLEGTLGVGEVRPLS